MPGRRIWLVGVLGVVLSSHAGLSTQYSVLSTQQAEPSFNSVSPPSALHAAVQSNLRIARDWLDQKDFVSAVQTAQCLVVLAELYGYQSADPAWRNKTSSLRRLFAQLGERARAKDATSCARTVKECEDLLTDLEVREPKPDAQAAKDFKPFGSLRIWMLLLDGTFADAKTARSAKELEQLSYALAEEANVVVHLRGDARWRQHALGLRDAALTAAKADDLETGRVALKKAYDYCEHCHDAGRRR